MTAGAQASVLGDPGGLGGGRFIAEQELGKLERSRLSKRGSSSPGPRSHPPPRTWWHAACRRHPHRVTRVSLQPRWPSLCACLSRTGKTPGRERCAGWHANQNRRQNAAQRLLVRDNLSARLGEAEPRGLFILLLLASPFGRHPSARPACGPASLVGLGFAADVSGEAAGLWTPVCLQPSLRGWHRLRQGPQQRDTARAGGQGGPAAAHLGRGN